MLTTKDERNMLHRIRERGERGTVALPPRVQVDHVTEFNRRFPVGSECALWIRTGRGVRSTLGITQEATVMSSARRVDGEDVVLLKLSDGDVDWWRIGLVSYRRKRAAS
jgi:hypothetical protein